MSRNPPDPSPIPLPDAEATLLARAYRLILSWPCPRCGAAFPCACCDEPARPAGHGGDGDDDERGPRWPLTPKRGGGR